METGHHLNIVKPLPRSPFSMHLRAWAFAHKMSLKSSLHVAVLRVTSECVEQITACTTFLPCISTGSADISIAFELQTVHGIITIRNNRLKKMDFCGQIPSPVVQSTSPVH